MNVNTPKIIKTIVQSIIVSLLLMLCLESSAADLNVANNSSYTIPDDGNTYTYDNVIVNGTLTVEGIMIVEGSFSMRPSFSDKEEKKNKKNREKIPKKRGN